MTNNSMDDRLRRKIEKKRHEMLELSNKHGINSEEVLICSKELDSLITEYQRLFQRRNKNE